MGGAILLRLFSENVLGADTDVIDGRITSHRLWKPLAYLINIRDFLMVWMSKHISLRLFYRRMNPDRCTKKAALYLQSRLRWPGQQGDSESFLLHQQHQTSASFPRPKGKGYHWYGSEEKKENPI